MGEGSRFGPAEYLGHQLLLKHQETRGYIPRSVFHKLWTITTRYLQDEYNYDVELPMFWYKYGEMADEASVNNDFFYRRSAPWAGANYAPVYDINPEEFEVTEDEQSIISQGVNWSIRRFGRRKTRFLKQHQYLVYAPNEFIRSYSELRDRLQYTNLDEQQVLHGDFEVDSNEELVISLLDEMVINFPAGKPGFSDLENLYLRWDDTARMLIEQTGDFGELDKFLDDFIAGLSRAVLQLEYHENIPSERFSDWEESAEEAYEDLVRIVSEHRNPLLEKRSDSGVLSRISETYDEDISSKIVEE